jgi:methyl-accepting chemotaxis protein
VTQANAAQSEELSSTAETLSGRAAQLRSLVERFRLDEEAEWQTHAAGSPTPMTRREHPAIARRSVAERPVDCLVTTARPSIAREIPHGGDKGFGEV